MHHVHVSLVIGGLLVGCAGARPPLVSDACRASLSSRDLQARARDAVVRIAMEAGSGSGFLLRPEEDRLFAVTNLHVVASGGAPSVHLDSGEKVEGEIVAVSHEDDLALLRLPAALKAPALPLNERTPDLGQELLVLGYPGVHGSSFALTAERGTITAEDRRLEDRTYLQTNANINPGNSGGPALDACGAVVGVVVAKITTTERTNLLVPVPRLVRLVSHHLTDRTPPRDGVRQTLADFFTRISRGEPENAARHLSRAFISERLGKYWSRNLAQIDRKITLARAIHPEATKEALVDTLSRREQLLLTIHGLREAGRLSARDAEKMIFGLYAEDELGRVAGIRVADIRPAGEAMLASLELRPPRGRARSLFVRLEKEWGRWSIDAIRAR